MYTVNKLGELQSAEYGVFKAEMCTAGIDQQLFSPLGVLAERAIYFTSSLSLQLVSLYLRWLLGECLLNVKAIVVQCLSLLFSFLDVVCMLVNWDRLDRLAY